VFTNTFLKIGSIVINEAAIVSINLDEYGKVAICTSVGPFTFSGASADALRRLFTSDPAVWAQREGPGWCGVLDLTPEEGV
jgi:hypothetical protein